MVSTDACEGETPAALTSIAISPYCCAVSINFRIEVRDDRSISTGSTSNPARFIVSATACAFSIRLSPTTIFIPYPIRRAIAMPICPAPVSNITSFCISYTIYFIDF